MARPKYPSDEVDKTMVRFPPGMMDRIKAAAAENHRSMNAEIVSRLEASLLQDERDAILSKRRSLLTKKRSGEVTEDEILAELQGLGEALSLLIEKMNREGA